MLRLLSALAIVLPGEVGGMRRRLLDMIESTPGQHASELSRNAGGPWSTVQYHLDMLARNDMITAIDAGRTKRFYPSTMDPRQARLLALMREGHRLAVARTIHDRPGLRQVDVCRQIDISRKSFRNAVAPLVAGGVIAEQRLLAENRYYGLDELGTLLDAADEGPTGQAPDAVPMPVGAEGLDPSLA